VFSFFIIIYAATNHNVLVQERLGEKLTKFGFKYSEDFTTNSRILVTDRAFGNKYTAAAKALYPIVKSDWVNDSYKSNSVLPLQSYFLPPFKGLTICVSQFSKHERTKIEKLAKENGATYTPSLTHSVTHLIIQRPEGEKFEFAKKLRFKQRNRDEQINIVNKEWFYKSISLGWAQSVAEYIFPEQDSEEISSYLARYVSIEIWHHPVY
jgi:hypothetical protein